MDIQPDPAKMTDLELVREWNCIDCDSEDRSRSDALAEEIQRRGLAV